MIINGTMQIQSFTKMIHFTRLIKAGGRLREFNFRKMKRNEEYLFSVDTVDDRGNRIIFFMQQESNKWTIVPQPLPSWIIENEDALSNQIETELHAA